MLSKADFGRLMLYSAQRTANFRSGRLDRPDEALMREGFERQEMQLVNFDSSARKNRSSILFERMMGRGVRQYHEDIPTTEGTNIPIDFYSRGKADYYPQMMRAIERSQARSKATRNLHPIVTLNRATSLCGRFHNIEFRGISPSFHDATLSNVYMNTHGAGAFGSNTHGNVKFAAGNFDYTNFAGSALTIEASAGTRFNNVKLHNASLQVRGAVTPEMADAHVTGNTRVNGSNLGGLMAAARHTLDYATRVTTRSLSSANTMFHDMVQHGKHALSPTAETFNYGQGRVRKHDPDAYPSPRFA